MHTVPPRITAAPSNLTVLENVFLNAPPPNCRATGEPMPTYTWFQPNGSPIPIIGGVPQFGVLTRSDSGTYACVATNRAGQVRAEFSILVEGKGQKLMSYLKVTLPCMHMCMYIHV